MLFWMCDFVALTWCCKLISFFIFNTRNSSACLDALSKYVKVYYRKCVDSGQVVYDVISVSRLSERCVIRAADDVVECT